MRGQKISITKEWLIDQYINNGRSTTDIANELKCDASVVYRRLIKYDITTRTVSEARLLNRNDGFNLNDMQLINGSLLGDACLSITPGGITPLFRKENKAYEYVLHTAKKIFDISPEKRISPIQHNNKKYNKIFEYYVTYSLCHTELTFLYNKWYPELNDRIKCVPKDLILDPRTVLYWYMDDGFLIPRYNKRPRDGKYRIGFASESFSKEDNEFLCDQLSCLGIFAYIVKKDAGTGYQINIPEREAKLFFDMIGKCPSDLETSMGYKWQDISVPKRILNGKRFSQNT